jgi:hypothetical protein
MQAEVRSDGISATFIILGNTAPVGARPMKTLFKEDSVRKAIIL